jgi:predicted O-methyltransferase YrrM
MIIDPFSLKALPYYHPRRAAYTAWVRFQDWRARRNYERFAIPLKPPPDGSAAAPTAGTAVTPDQYRCLEAAVRATEHLGDAPVVEIGAYRGVTTRYFAELTRRPVVAVDPFGGHGATADDFAAFRAATAGLPNVSHLRATSGEGRAQWPAGRAISLLFIDAMHDYANTRFDILSWRPLLAPGGIVALHDVDQLGFAGTRRAAAELFAGYPLFAHVDNLAAFLVPDRRDP